MKMYSYKCRSCDTQFDVIDTLLDVVYCPFCREEVQRDYRREANPIHFRGKGFYKNDNKKEGK